MLLMTTLTLGGRDSLHLFDRLPADVAQRIREKADALLALDAEKRVNFMLKQMKRALSFKGLRGVERVDPSWILGAMRGESPRTVAAILVSMPPPVVRAVLKRLPHGIRKNLPPKDELQQAPVELVRAVRQIFESRFHAMPMTSGRTFSFPDVIQLERKELYRLLRELGLEQLGQAFMAVGRLALAELCRRLPRRKAEELIMAVRRASKVDAPNLKAAQMFLSKVVANFEDPEDFFQKAGLWRIAKAASIEGEAFCAAFRQRVPKDAGELFYVYVEKARELENLDNEALERLQDSVVLRVRDLAEEGSIGAQWGHLKLKLHNPEAAQSDADADMPATEPEQDLD